MKNDIFRWVEKALDADIIASSRPYIRAGDAIERDDWFATIRRHGTEQKIYIRCGRSDDFKFNVHDLNTEVRILKILAAHGVPVPEVLAESAVPPVAVMTFVEGDDNPAAIGNLEDRKRVILDFARTMARWHAIPAESFIAAGLGCPTGPTGYLMREVLDWEVGASPALRTPVPLITFICRWLIRNIPLPGPAPVLVQGDTGPGQFIFGEGRVRAVLDWEGSRLGDPMQDLAHFRTRDVWYQTGFFPELIAQYSAASGREIDAFKIRYYSIENLLARALVLTPHLQESGEFHSESIRPLRTNIWSRYSAIEELASLLRIPPPEAELHALTSQSQHPEGATSSAPPAPGVQAARYMENRRLHSAKLEYDELDDMTRLLGFRPTSVREGHGAIERLVKQSGNERDAELAAYFWRHALREERLVRGLLPRVDAARVSPLT